MIELEINHQKITVHDGATVIQAADQAGIYIPRFCYHRKLSIVANCRMCLVEVEGVAKPLPACATPVSAGMKVLTASEKALEAQRSVMEFLLINHPLDCPICDQGGECELQDLSMGYGKADSEYNQSKRAVSSDDLGPLIGTEMTRCIHCTRCVRFGDEIAGLPEIGATDRGEDMHIGTYVKHFMHSEISGNIIDICPVGALTSKPFSYHARSWEMREHSSIAPHDCLGSHISIHTRALDNAAQRCVMRVVPRENENINENWLSDRDRFSYEGVYHEDRVFQPMVKRKGQWHTIDWKAALLEVADRTRAIVELQGAEEIGALASPSSTLEEFYLLQKYMRALGSSNVDHRLTQLDLSDEPEWGLGMPLHEMNQLDAVLLVGSNLRHEQPLASTRLYKAHQRGASVMAITSMETEFSYALSHTLIVSSTQLIQSLAEVAWALAQLQGKSLSLPKISISPVAQQMAERLKKAERSAIFIGAEAINHPQASQLRYLVQVIAELSGASYGAFSLGANTAGAWLAGAVPHRTFTQEGVKQGLDAKAMLGEKALRAYYLLGTELEYDSAYPAVALAALKKAGLVVCLSAFKSEAMLEYADFILPMAPFSENSGTFVNALGEWQSFTAASVPHGESRPAWKILRVLANLMELPGFEYEHVRELRDELKTQLPETTEPKTTATQLTEFSTIQGLTRFAPCPIYRTDALVRRSAALQATQTILMPQIDSIAVNQTTADQYQLKSGEIVTAIQGNSSLSLPLSIHPGLADGMVLLPLGLTHTAGFGAAFAPIQLERGAA